jgi:hypothetical protein
MKVKFLVSIIEILRNLTLDAYAEGSTLTGYQNKKRING